MTARRPFLLTLSLTATILAGRAAPNGRGAPTPTAAARDVRARVDGRPPRVLFPEVLRPRRREGGIDLRDLGILPERAQHRAGALELRHAARQVRAAAGAAEEAAVVEGRDRVV